MGDVKIESVMPLGRSREEYVGMFALSEADLSSSILSCADGPASFNAEMTALGCRVVSVDPVYVFSAEEIGARIEETRELILANTREHLDRYRWDRIRSLEDLEMVRMAAMRRFLGDVEAGKGRYIAGSLPKLEFADQSFDLVLCSHCLFTYTEQLDLDFHIAAILEMLRMGREMRVFPLVDMNGDVSAHLEPVMAALKEKGFRTTKTIVDYEFQKGGTDCCGCGGVRT